MTLKDRYVIEKELAHGFSVVYLARDKQLLSRRVVIKLLRGTPRTIGRQSLV